MTRIARLISGGQTGADRAALDVAVEHGLPYAGWCPRGGSAEDLPAPPGVLARYPHLREADSDDPAVRTRLNVRDSDATLVIGDPDTSPGTALTVQAARELDKPCLATTDPAEAATWLAGLSGPVTLNVAGPRESEQPGSYVTARRVLEHLARRAPQFR